MLDLRMCPELLDTENFRLGNWHDILPRFRTQFNTKNKLLFENFENAGFLKKLVLMFLSYNKLKTNSLLFIHCIHTLKFMGRLFPYPGDFGGNAHRGTR